MYIDGCDWFEFLKIPDPISASGTSCLPTDRHLVTGCEQNQRCMGLRGSDEDPRFCMCASYLQVTHPRGTRFATMAV